MFRCLIKQLPWWVDKMLNLHPAYVWNYHCYPSVTGDNRRGFRNPPLLAAEENITRYMAQFFVWTTCLLRHLINNLNKITHCHSTDSNHGESSTGLITGLFSSTNKPLLALWYLYSQQEQGHLAEITKSGSGCCKVRVRRKEVFHLWKYGSRPRGD